ncbi:MAG: hypothetical protein ACP5OC_04710 [Thermoplasmata archaeon]
MVFGIFAVGLLAIVAFIVSWIILSIPLYLSAKALTNRSNLLEAMGASFLIVLFFFLLSIIGIIGIIIWIFLTIAIIAGIYRTSYLKAILIAIIAIVIYIIIAAILALLLGITLIATTTALVTIPLILIH